LNPLRAKLVKILAQLDRYRWSGHSVLMGIIKHDWQDCDYVLRYFDQKGKHSQESLSYLCQKKPSIKVDGPSLLVAD
jgi:hypothetical protein